jgi:LPXTG-motif cell wall-anchored protein
VNPAVTIPVTFPQDARDCVTTSTPVSRFLPQTGTEVAATAGVAVGLVALGGATLAAVRRRRAGE